MAAIPYESTYSRADFDGVARRRALVLLAILMALAALGAVVAIDMLDWPWAATLLAAAAIVEIGRASWRGRV